MDNYACSVDSTAFDVRELEAARGSSSQGLEGAVGSSKQGLEVAQYSYMETTLIQTPFPFPG